MEGEGRGTKSDIYGRHGRFNLLHVLCYREDGSIFLFESFALLSVSHIYERIRRFVCRRSEGG